MPSQIVGTPAAFSHARRCQLPSPSIPPRVLWCFPALRSHLPSPGSLPTSPAPALPPPPPPAPCSDCRRGGRGGGTAGAPALADQWQPPTRRPGPRGLAAANRLAPCKTTRRGTAIIGSAARAAGRALGRWRRQRNRRAGERRPAPFLRYTARAGSFHEGGQSRVGGGGRGSTAAPFRQLIR